MDASTEFFLGWVMAVAWFGFFIWIFWQGLTGIVAQPREAFREILADPIQYLLLLVMLGGLMLFLFWLVAAISPISINHIRPLGVPLGLWGFGIAALCLPFLKFKLALATG